jgi:NifU-like protein involved in Fe-S cluster formation
MIDDIYNKDVLRLAANISGLEPLARPDIITLLRSRLCGSTIEVSLLVENNIISGFSQQIKACALGQASASVMATAAIGKSKKDIKLAREQVKKMLETGEPLLAADWKALAALAPASKAQPRHGAIFLPFDAVINALEKIEK